MFGKLSFVNRLSLRLISWIWIVPCLVLFAIVFSPDSNAADAWLLKQVRFGEPLEVTFAADNLKVVLPMRSWSAVTSAPDWKVHTFNTKSKLYFDTTFANWLELSALDRIVDQREVYDKASSLKVLSSGTYGEGISLRRKIIFKSLGEMIGGSGWHAVSTVKSKMDADEKKKDKVKSYSCLYAPSLGSEKINKFLYNLCYIPPSRGAPIRYTVNLETGGVVARLITTSVTAIKIDKSTFKVPTGLAKANTPQEPAVATDRKDVETMFNDLDFGRPFGTDDTKKTPAKH